MKITLLSEDSIRLEGPAGTLTIEADSHDKSYSPFHMLASALASCTHAVLSSWAGNAKLDAEQLVINVNWTFAEDPHRVDQMNVTFSWPGLPPERVSAAKRAAALCAVHHTLRNQPSIVIEAAQ